MRTKDLTSGVLLFLVGCGICGYAIRTSLGSITQPGAGFFAFLTGAAILIFSLVIIFWAFRLPKPVPAEKTKESLRWRNIIILSLGVLAYSYGLEFLGYLIATILLMIFLFRTIEPQPWWMVLLGGISTTMISYLLFQVWLKIDLPIGFLGI